MQTGAILSRLDLADQVHRVRRLIPGIADENARRFVSLSAFQTHIPERLFDSSVATSAYLCLSREAEEASHSLSSLLISQDREMAMAFRALRDINSLAIQDADWPAFEDLEQFRSLEHIIHPGYLKLCEAVLGPLLLPIAIRSRRLRGKSTEISQLYQRVEEAERQSLALQAYDRIVRNAIAHGKVHYSLEGISYVDSRDTRNLTARALLQLVWVVKASPKAFRVEIKTAKVEVDCCTEAFTVTEPAGCVLDPLDLRVDALGAGVGDTQDDGVEDTVEMPLDHPGDLSDRLEARTDRPIEPGEPSAACPAPRAVVPKTHGQFFDRPGTGRFEYAFPQGLEVLPSVFAEVIRVPQPEILGAFKLFVTRVQQRSVLLPPHLVHRLT